MTPPKAKLLVVEDDIHLLSGLRDILELDNYEVLAAENGLEGLQILEHHQHAPPDLILSDVMMPVMDGLAFLKAVRQREQWVRIPFIFLTAKGEKADIHQGKNLGVDDYLIKPFDADDLLVAVSSKLRRYHAIHQVQEGMVNDLKRNILTILNHEFRTPLTLVVAYADMLKEYDAEKMTSAQLLEFLHGVNSGAERLRRLIENFILLVEIEAGDAERTYEWRKHEIANLHDILDTVHRQMFIRDGVQHTAQLILADDLPPVVGDEVFLGVAVRELLDNAVKFSQPAHPITLCAEPVEDELHIWVEDRGRGIPEAEFDLIWQSFYQVSRDRYEDQGAGTGLSIVKGIIELHSGRVWVQSQVGRGSRFTIALPLL